MEVVSEAKARESSWKTWGDRKENMINVGRTVRHLQHLQRLCLQKSVFFFFCAEESDGAIRGLREGF